jgi:hypothetical protein
LRLTKQKKNKKMINKIKMKMMRGQLKDLRSLQKPMLNIKVNLKEIYKK